MNAATGQTGAVLGIEMGCLRQAGMMPRDTGKGRRGNGTVMPYVGGMRQRCARPLRCVGRETEQVACEATVGEAKADSGRSCRAMD